MNNDIKAEWQKNLRSGEFVQGSGRLRSWDEEKQRWVYCCLGVLCEMSGLGTWKEDTAGDGTRYAIYLGEKCYLPIEVAEWAGINTAHHDESVQYQLSEMNDEGKTFYSIADDLPSVLAEYDERDVKPCQNHGIPVSFFEKWS